MQTGGGEFEQERMGKRSHLVGRKKRDVHPEKNGKEQKGEKVRLVSSQESRGGGGRK